MIKLVFALILASVGAGFAQTSPILNSNRVWQMITNFVGTNVVSGGSTNGQTATQVTNINAGLMNTASRRLGTNVSWVNALAGSNTTATNGDKLFPYANIGRAYSNSLAGSTIVVEPGNYHSETIIVTNGGRFDYMPGAIHRGSSAFGLRFNAGNMTIGGNGSFISTNECFYIVGYSPTLTVQADEISSGAGSWDIYSDTGGYSTWNITKPLRGRSFFSGTSTNYIKVPDFSGELYAYAGAKVYLEANIQNHGLLRAYGTGTEMWVNGDMNSRALGLFAETNSITHTRGNWVADSDVLDFRTGARGDHVGNLTAQSDAGLFVDTDGGATVSGIVANNTFDGKYQLAGNGAGIFNGAGTNGGYAYVVGGAKGIFGIVNANGYTRVDGYVIGGFFNGFAPDYRDYTTEALYGVGSQFYPPDRTNWIGNAVALIGSGTVEINNGPVWSTNYAAVHMRGFTNNQNPTLILANTVVGSHREWPILADGGRIVIRGHVHLSAGSNVTTSTYTTNTTPIVIDLTQGTLSYDKPLGTNFVLIGTNNIAPKSIGNELHLGGRTGDLGVIRWYEWGNNTDYVSQYFQNGSLNFYFTNEFLTINATNQTMAVANIRVQDVKFGQGAGELGIARFYDWGNKGDSYFLYANDEEFNIFFTNEVFKIRGTNGQVTLKDGTTMGSGHLAGLGASFSSMLVSGTQTNTGPIRSTSSLFVAGPVTNGSSVYQNNLGTNANTVSVLGKLATGEIVETALTNLAVMRLGTLEVTGHSFLTGVSASTMLVSGSQTNGGAIYATALGTNAGVVSMIGKGSDGRLYESAIPTGSGGSATNLTPWTTNILGAGFNLSAVGIVSANTGNFGSLVITGAFNVGTLSATNFDGSALASNAAPVHFWASSNGTNMVKTAVPSGGSSSLTTNANQFGPSVMLTLKDGVELTNAVLRGTTEAADLTATTITTTDLTANTLAVSGTLTAGTLAITNRLVVTNIGIQNLTTGAFVKIPHSYGYVPNVQLSVMCYTPITGTGNDAQFAQFFSPGHEVPHSQFYTHAGDLTAYIPAFWISASTSNIVVGAIVFSEPDLGLGGAPVAGSDYVYSIGNPTNFYFKVRVNP